MDYPKKAISMQLAKKGPAYSFISKWEIGGAGSYHAGTLDISVFLMFLRSLDSLEIFSIEIRPTIEAGGNHFMFMVQTRGIRDTFLSFQLPVTETDIISELQAIGVNLNDHRPVAA